MQPVTSEYGELQFHKVFKGQQTRHFVTKEPMGLTGSIGELTNGSWVHFPKGTPIRDIAAAREFLQSVNPEACERFDAWREQEAQRQAEEAAAPAVRPIKIVACAEAPGSMLVFDDGADEPVTDAGDVVAFYSTPGALQEFALSIYRARYEQRQAATLRDELATPRAKLARELEAKRAAKVRQPKPLGAAKYFTQAPEDALTQAIDATDDASREE